MCHDIFDIVDVLETHCNLLQISLLSYSDSDSHSHHITHTHPFDIYLCLFLCLIINQQSKRISVAPGHRKGSRSGMCMGEWILDWSSQSEAKGLG